MDLAIQIFCIKQDLLQNSILVLIVIILENKIKNLANVSLMFNIVFHFPVSLRLEYKPQVPFAWPLHKPFSAPNSDILVCLASLCIKFMNLGGRWEGGSG